LIINTCLNDSMRWVSTLWTKNFSIFALSTSNWIVLPQSFLSSHQSML
jgi:hypothetical protein